MNVRDNNDVGCTLTQLHGQTRKRPLPLPGSGPSPHPYG